MSINHNGVYTFRIAAYGSKALNVYTDGIPGDGTNVNLYKYSSTDSAQKWRAVYAGLRSEGEEMFWLNTESAPNKSMALDRYIGSNNLDNADVYSSRNSSAADQLVYFTHPTGSDSIVQIRLFHNDYALTATLDGNVLWSPARNDNLSQRWTVTEREAGQSISDIDNQITRFPEKYYYTAANNTNYPDFVGECVWYCKGRVYEATGKPCKISGDGKAWATNARNAGMKVDNTPSPNCVACWNSGDWGHVAFVEDVVGDRIYYSEANFVAFSDPRFSDGQVEVGDIGEDGQKKSETKDVFEGLMRGFDGYIHF